MSVYKYVLTLTLTLGLNAAFILSGCNSDDEGPVSLGNVEIYVSDAATPSKIVKYDGKGENGAIFTSTNLAWSQDILFLEDQNVALVSNLSAGNIARFNASTGEFIDYFAEGIGGPTRMKIGKDNLLYVLQWNGGLVRRYNLDGTFVDQFTSVAVSQSIGIDWDAQGNMYISSFAFRHVRKFGPTGEDLGVFTKGFLNGPTNIWFDSNGNLLVLDWKAGVVKQFDSEGNEVSTVIKGLSKPEGVVVLADGRILIGNGGTSSVKLYDGDYKFIKDIVASGAAGLAMPNAVYVRNK